MKKYFMDELKIKRAFINECQIDLTGKNVLITGAGGDIGSVIVLKFLKGANCFCLIKI